MRDRVLLARVERDDRGMQRVLAPEVGVWIDPPPAGALVGPGSRVGGLLRLNRRHRLVLPEGAGGAIVPGLPSSRAVPVEYGRLLFELAPIAREASLAPTRDGAVLGHPNGLELPDGALAIVSPTDGIFYLRAAPDAPPFVAVGAIVRRGEPVGLVEVMKTFNQIVYDGPGFPDLARVLEIRAGDASEVRSGEPLVVVVGAEAGAAGGDSGTSSKKSSDASRAS